MILRVYVLKINLKMIFLYSDNINVKMSERGYIYIIQPEFVIENIFKIGKTVNIESTYQTYSRMINIKKKHFYVVNYLSYIEALILNILGRVIDHVVCWVINWVSMYGKETLIH